MPNTTYNISLKGYVGGLDFDRSTVEKTHQIRGRGDKRAYRQPRRVSRHRWSISAAFKNHGKINVHFVGLSTSTANIASYGTAVLSLIH